MKTALKIAAITASSAIILASCGKSGADDGATEAASTQASAPALSGWGDASADFINAEGDKTGDVALKEAPPNGVMGGVLIRVSVSGLSQGWHGMHLHQIGDCSDGAAGFKASGGHVNPDGRQHGLLNPDGPERADIPNIYAGSDGQAVAEIFASQLSLSVGAEGPIENGLYNLMDADGFAIVIHENPDDHMTQPIGGAGSRVACAAFSLGE